MPKMKTRSGVSKRLKISGSGKLIRKGAFTSQLARSKSRNQKKRLRRVQFLAKGDAKRIKSLLPYHRTKLS